MVIGRICLRPTSPPWMRTPASTDRYLLPASLSCLMCIHEKIFCISSAFKTHRGGVLDTRLGVPWMKGHST